MKNETPNTLETIASTAQSVTAAIPLPQSQMASLLIFAVRELIKQAPSIAQDVGQLLSKGIPTDQEWEDLRAKVEGETYANYVPDSILPPDPIGASTAIPAATPLMALAPPEPAAVTAVEPPAATPAPALAAVPATPTAAKPALTYEALVTQSKALVDAEPYPGTVLARVFALEKVVSIGLGKSLDQVLAS